MGAWDPEKGCNISDARYPQQPARPASGGKGLIRVEDLYPDPYPTIPCLLPAGVYPTRDNPYSTHPSMLRSSIRLL
jgi:hypothetical protein